MSTRGTVMPLVRDPFHHILGYALSGKHCKA